MVDPLWVSSFITLILVIITGYYAWETKKIRLEAIRPNFALKIDFLNVGGGIKALYLVNTGGTARNVKIDVQSDDMIFEKFFFAPSIVKDDSVYLYSNLDKLKEDAEKIEVKLLFEDGYNRKLSDFLELDFGTLQYEEFEEREIATHYKQLDFILKEFERAIKKKIKNDLKKEKK